MKLLRGLLLASVLFANFASFHAFAQAPTTNSTKQAFAVPGKDGWLFLTAERRFLSIGKFWGAEAAKVSQLPKPELADPLPAIVDFNDQLKARGISLLLVPVPPKAAIYAEQIVDAWATPAMAREPLRNFYAELRKAGVDVLDLFPYFDALKNSPEAGEAPFCKTDSHWSPVGCQTAATSIAQFIEEKLGKPAVQIPFRIAEKEIAIDGDLVAMLPKDVSKPGKETLKLRQVSTADGKAIEPDSNSPVLLMGDSHTLVFHEFSGERAGLLDQLALELYAAPDLIGTRGSGATAVRISLYRKSLKDPAYLSKKKVVVWCFAAREFTESDQGWAKVPVAK